MKTIVARSPAKLNLTFEIISTMPDGFHQIATIYQSIDLEDELHFELRHSSQTCIGLSVTPESRLNGFPCDDSNLICAAANAFLSTHPGRPGIDMKVAIEKNIPIGAGMAGGSSNAAATLLVLNNFFEHPLSTEELLALAGRLGADVPFCLEGGTCVGTGKGDLLSPVKTKTTLTFLIVKPTGLSISTPWAYRAYDDSEGQIAAPSLDEAVRSLADGDLEKIASCLGNVFEPVIHYHYPVVAELSQHLLDLGAWSCHLTGKGPTMYALVADREMAHSLRRRFLERLNSTGSGDLKVDCFIAESVPYGARLLEKSPSRTR